MHANSHSKSEVPNLAMAKLHPQLFPFVALLSLLLPNSVVHSQDTTSFTFDSFSSQPTNLIYQDHAVVPLNCKFLRLASLFGPLSCNVRSLSYSTVGRVLYSHPVQFWEPGRQASFKTTIKFVITPPSDGSPPADGIAFFIAPVNSPIPPGSEGGNLGIFGASGTSSSTFAVEFDTYVNSPWDPSVRHIGIDINSRNSRNVTRFDSIIGREVTACINYDATTRRISVVATDGSQNYTVSHIFDLKTILPHQVQVGISASTGGGAAFHDIQSWYFKSTLASDPNSISVNEKTTCTPVDERITFAGCATN